MCRALVIGVAAVPLTQWIIAIASLGSALIALALAFGLKEWLFRPRVRMVLRGRSEPDAISDRVLTQRIDTGETAAFIRLRLANSGRSTARNVGVRILQVHRWDDADTRWTRTRPELDGRLLQPSNQLPSEPDTVDVFPYSDRIVDLASVGFERERALHVEIGHPWPPNAANVLAPGRWKLSLLVCGDNIKAQHRHVVVGFDGHPTDPETDAIWEHFTVEGPSIHDLAPVSQHEPASSRA